MENVPNAFLTLGFGVFVADMLDMNCVCKDLKLIPFVNDVTTLQQCTSQLDLSAFKFSNTNSFKYSYTVYSSI